MHEQLELVDDDGRLAPLQSTPSLEMRLRVVMVAGSDEAVVYTELWDMVTETRLEATCTSVTYGVSRRLALGMEVMKQQHRATMYLDPF